MISKRRIWDSLLILLQKKQWKKGLLIMKHWLILYAGLICFSKHLGLIHKVLDSDNIFKMKWPITPAIAGMENFSHHMVGLSAAE